MKLRIVIFWVAASLCLFALLFAQRQMMLDNVREELDAEAQVQAEILARSLVRTLLDARVETDADIDEFLVRQPVFDFMENRSVLACAVYGKDRILEAQMRDADGNLAPLDGLASLGMCEWTEKLVTERRWERSGLPSIPLPGRRACKKSRTRACGTWWP